MELRRRHFSFANVSTVLLIFLSISVGFVELSYLCRDAAVGTPGHLLAQFSFPGDAERTTRAEAIAQAIDEVRSQSAYSSYLPFYMSRIWDNQTPYPNDMPMVEAQQDDQWPLGRLYQTDGTKAFPIGRDRELEGSIADSITATSAGTGLDPIVFFGRPPVLDAEQQTWGDELIELGRYPAPGEREMRFFLQNPHSPVLTSSFSSYWVNSILIGVGVAFVVLLLGWAVAGRRPTALELAVASKLLPPTRRSGWSEFVLEVWDNTGVARDRRRQMRSLLVALPTAAVSLWIREWSRIRRGEWESDESL